MSRLNRFLSFVTYVYLLRFPLLTAAAVVGIAQAAFFTNARLLLGGLFDVSERYGVFLVSFTAFLAAWTVMLTWRLVLLYGQRRFGAVFLPVKPNVHWRHIALSGLLALPIVIGVIVKSDGGDGWEIAGAVLGLLFALLALWAAAISRKFFTRPQFTQRPDDEANALLAGMSPDMFIPTQGALTRPLIDRVSRYNPAGRAADIITRLLSRIPGQVGRGYFVYRGRRVVAILPGHVLATTMLSITFIFYVAVGVAKYARLGSEPYLPTLCYVLLLLMVLCWVLSGLGFFLDRWRIPVLIPLLLWLTFTSLWPSADHFFCVIVEGDRGRCPLAATRQAALPRPPAAIPPLTPGSAASAASPCAPPPESAPNPSTTPTPCPTPVHGDSIVVVAANGGGIQAAAWAARVLTGLEESLRPEFGDRFGRSIRVISAVSGGSVGAMYFANEYDEQGNLPADLSQVVERAEGSSLDEVAWGLVYPDLARALLPLRYKWDRGLALEQAWLLPDKDWGRRENVLRGLAEWGEDAQARRRPVMIFNTTITDTGERLPLSTLPPPDCTRGRNTFDQLFKEAPVRPDIPVLTATRLSASFPYVSPAARADVPCNKAAHIVDGGYYDNYGVSSLVEWLDAELSKGDNRIGRVLVVQVRGGPTDSAYIYEREGVCPTLRRDVYQRESSRGWFYQAFAPLATLLHVRDTGQLSHNEVELRLLEEKWKGRGVAVTDVVFEFDGADSPTSWHLTEPQKDLIEWVWRAKVADCDGRHSLTRVNDFLRGAGGTQ